MIDLLLSNNVHRRQVGIKKISTESDVGAADVEESPITAKGGNQIDLFGTYTRIWALQQMAQCGLFDLLATSLQAAGPGGMNRSFMALKVKSDARAPYLLPFILLAAVWPSVPVVLVAHVGNIVLHMTRAPFIWDHELWDLMTECCVVVAMVGQLLQGMNARIATGAAVVKECGPWVRAMMITFYFGAAFWKLNRSFFDLRASCGPVFIAQLVAAYVPECMAIDALFSQVAFLTPWITVLVEFAIPTLLSLRGRWCLAGLGLGLLFHFMIALTPPPNNAGGFSVGAIVRYFFFIPIASASTLLEIKKIFTNARYALLGIASAGVVGVSVYVGALQAALTFQGALPVFMMLMLFYVRALLIQIPGDMPMVVLPGAAQKTSTKVTRLIGYSLLGISFVYTFGLPVLGLQDMAACNMFANLHGPTAVYTGMNHFLLPTGLLQAAFEQSNPEGPFAGGVVEVLYTDSHWMRNLFPAEGTRMLTERTKAMLHAAGHSGKEFNPSTTRVVGTFPGMRPPANMSEQIPYLLPAVELRRLLAEARDLGETFSLHYRRVSRTAPFNGRIVHLHEVAGGERSCSLKGSDEGKLCDSDELALLPPVKSWATSLLLAFPMPMAKDGKSELGCLA